MIRTLFLKIFLWFWLAMTLVVVAIILATQTVPIDSRSNPVGMVGNFMIVYAYTAGDIFEREGEAALAEYLDRLDRLGRVRAYLFDRRGVEVSRQRAPESLRELASHTWPDGRIELRVTGRATRGAQRTFAAHANGYVLAGELRRDLFEALITRPRLQLLRLLAVLLTAGLVCYGLARYLTTPITRLRTAAQQLAGGDLSARVGAVTKRRTDELVELGRDFDRMAERLQRLVDSQRALLTDISHELRSPLARLNVALALARPHAGEAAQGALDRIEREAERLNALVGQLLTLARLEMGAEGPEKGCVDLAGLLDEIVADADFEARSVNGRVRVIRSEACTVLGHPELLRSALENIVRNAVGHTGTGTAVDVRLTAASDGAGGEARIVIRDYGPGVPESTLTHLFQPFYRVPTDGNGHTPGAGLGLAITERAVRVHGGLVTAVNAPGGGLQVEIRLPLAVDTDRPHGQCPP